MLVQTKPDRHASGSPSGRAGAQAPERARLLTETPKHSDNTALSKALLIAVQQLFGNGLALSVTFGDTSPKGRGFGKPHRFLYLFGELYDIIVLRLVPPNLPRMGEGGCRLMAYIFSFVLSVAANVASYYICKWLDGWLKGRKH